MGEDRKPPEGRRLEDDGEVAEDSLELAKVLVGQGGLSGRDFLERLARSDEFVDHDGEACGLCHNMVPAAPVRP
jgi:hypothetical protein